MKVKDFVKKNIAYHNTLNPVAWSGDHLKPEVRLRLLEIAKIFVDYLEIPGFRVLDVVLTGSLANYNWSEYSDIDLHVVIDKKAVNDDAVLVDEFFTAKKELYNLKHDIKIKGYDVELYAQDINETLDSKGKYSVLYNKWIDTPSIDDFELDKQSIIKKVKEFNKILANLEKLEDSQDKIIKIDAFKEKIRKYRKNGLITGGELSNENLVFKYLRRSGFMEKLSDLKTKTSDSILSLENAELLPK